MVSTPDAEAAPEPRDADEALDAYSQIVTRVARTVSPHVAAVEVRAVGRGSRSRGGAGSAVVFTEDGYLLTNAHVVGGATTGQAEFADGTEAALDVVGSDPLSDLAVLHSRGVAPPPASSATRRCCALASSSSPSATRSASPAP